MKQDDNLVTYETSDINLASCLKLEGYDLETIKKGDDNKGIFVFNDVDQSFIDRFDLGKLLVEPVAFNNTIKQLTTSVRRMFQR
jgi:hypothetical protein